MVTPDGLGRRHTLLTVIGCVAAAVCIVALYYLVDPSSGLYLRCPFKLATGLDCPGCGSQRAIHALLHGDIATAWRSNALFILWLPLIALLTTAHLIRRRHPRLERMLNSQVIILTLLAVILLWTIVRNLLHL